MSVRTVVLAATCALLAGASAAGASYAAVTAITEPSASGVITSCFNTTSGAVRMVTAGATCAAGEKKLTWASNTRPKVHVVGAAGEPAYQNSWKAYDGPPFANASFYKDSSGVVHLTGLTCTESAQDSTVCTSGTLIGGTVPMFTLPVGFRPASQLLFTTLSYGGSTYEHTRIDVTTTGVVELIAPPNGGENWVSFDGISFLAA
jgi:hypothetical protein